MRRRQSIDGIWLLMGGNRSRNKGQRGEREVYHMLNDIVDKRRKLLGLPALAPNDKLFQRNQNQTAVGGDDLSNPLGLSIEVKFQEKFAITTWWKQTCASAKRSRGEPVLIYRKAHVPWRVMMLGYLTGWTGGGHTGPVPVDIAVDAFCQWFDIYYQTYLKNNPNS